MKTLFLIALLLTSAACFAQNNTDGLFVKPKDKTGIYSFSVEQTKPFQKQNYLQARHWAITNLHAKNIPENKLRIVAGKAFLTVTGLNNKQQYPFTAQFQIDVTDSKCSLRFFDLILKDQNTLVTQRQLIMHGSKTVPVAQAYLLVKKMSDVLRAAMDSFKATMEK